ncbi:MAG: acyl-CoA thioesterase [Actinobacteria bacterium]|nr:acyl-CoA thioesterase [Actinomycetota bacterium]
MSEHETPASIRIQRRIEWSDTDASGHWHNTAAFRMIEWAETALFERLGFLDDVYGHLPRVHISIDFTESLDHRDLVDVRLAIVDVGRTSITYDFSIERDGRECVRAKVVTALRTPDDASREWPDEYKRLLVTAGPQAPELLVVPEQPAEEPLRRVRT